jgi:hypothetical protein
MVKDDKLSSGAWTLAALCLGLAVIAACIIVPQADANRRMAYERARLEADLDQINHQASVNEEFLAKIESDPQLAQRLAQRQMKFIRQGESLLPYKSQSAPSAAPVSPFSLVHVPPPAAFPAYEPAGGILSRYLLDSHVRLYCLGGGLFLVAMGLVCSSNAANDSRLGT